MHKEIGSFFEYRDVESEWFDILSNRQISFLAFFLRHISNKQIAFYDSGRSALMQALYNIAGCRRDLKCLVPAYTCSTVLRPFINSGFKLFFYSVDQNLETNEDDIRRQLMNTAPDVFLFHNYFGVNCIDPETDCLREYRKKGGIIIEDYTQFLFGISQTRIDNVDYSIGSLRKWFPITDGGFLISNDIVKEETEVFDELIKLKAEAQSLKRQYLDGDKTIEKDTFLKINAEAERMLDDMSTVHSMSLNAYSKLMFADIEKIKSKRSFNAMILEKGLTKIEEVSPVIKIENGAIPLYYPIYVNERERLQAYLKENNIFAPVLWPRDNCISINSEMLEHIYKDILCLPCDERYDVDDMERIVSVINDKFIK